MIRNADIPDTIPLFPLEGALLLPQGRLPLNIFEPRYLAMVEDVLKTPHRLIGMIQPRGMPKGASGNDLHQIGCAGRLTSFAETEDGRYQITLSGFSRFRLLAQNQGFTPYLRGDISFEGFEADRKNPSPDEGFDRDAFFDLLRKYFKGAGLSSDMDSMLEADENLLINSLSMLCPFSVEEKQSLLEAPDLINRRETLVTLMQFSLAGDKGVMQ